ncbi:hypothetical protein E5284_15270 [Citrobacter freundii]|nr:hypothetical protein E5284_15270 [Citrobacter freundii]
MTKLNRYFVTPTPRMNLSGVISLLIFCCMVKKGTKKDAFYAEESDWRYDAAASVDAAGDGDRAGASVV